jgi:hypothetical protein
MWGMTRENYIDALEDLANTHGGRNPAAAVAAYRLAAELKGYLESVPLSAREVQTPAQAEHAIRERMKELGIDPRILRTGNSRTSTPA